MASLIARRMAECPSRRQTGCGRIDVALGWSHGMPIHECDVCWAKGPESPESAAYRGTYVKGVVEAVARPQVLAKLEPTVVLTVLSKHLPKDRARELLRAMTPDLGDALAVNAGRLTGIEGEVREIMGTRTPQERLAKTHPRERWVKVQDSWKLAHSFLASLASRVFSGRATDDVISLRQLSCFGAPEAGRAPCTSLFRGPNGFHYCGECGCGERDIARIDGPGYPKLAYPHLECPQQRPGFSNAAP